MVKLGFFSFKYLYLRGNKNYRFVGKQNNWEGKQACKNNVPYLCLAKTSITLTKQIPFGFASLRKKEKNFAGTGRYGTVTAVQ